MSSSYTVRWTTKDRPLVVHNVVTPSQLTARVVASAVSRAGGCTANVYVPELAVPVMRYAMGREVG